MKGKDEEYEDSMVNALSPNAATGRASSYLNRSQKLLEHILTSIISETVKYLPKNFDPEKSSNYRYSMMASI